MPAGFGRIAAHALSDDQDAHGLARLGRQLQPPPRRQRQRFLRAGNHHPHRARTQRLFTCPKQISLPFRPHQQQPRWRQDRCHRPRHQLFALMGQLQP